ncbi:hypothetical protein FVE85_5699 [Porphyridium purpureum]|uniref:Uncharacterized protein n=1 Tax=Porphyridium purpureum TaxID=35688 RepID=A0A5J4Z569_PORPP|nr:hypothetical protein FVE85_5699 [Porphyridium purpureum]|eukprot:POR8883..scf295_1
MEAFAFSASWGTLTPSLAAPEPAGASRHAPLAAVAARSRRATVWSSASRRYSAGAAKMCSEGAEAQRSQLQSEFDALFAQTASAYVRVERGPATGTLDGRRAAEPAAMSKPDMAVRGAPAATEEASVDASVSPALAGERPIADEQKRDTAKMDRKAQSALVKRVEKATKLVKKEMERMEKSARKLRELERELMEIGDLLRLQFEGKEGACEDSDSSSCSEDDGMTMNNKANMGRRTTLPGPVATLARNETAVGVSEVKVCTGKACARNGGRELLADLQTLNQNQVRVCEAKCLDKCKGSAPTLEIDGALVKELSPELARLAVQTHLARFKAVQPVNG